MATIPNIGIDLGFTPPVIRRLIFCLKLNDSGTANKISLANAASLANWQTQFNQYTHLADCSDRFVPSPKVRELAKTEAEATFWEVEDYKVKMRNANADITFALLDPSPYILKNLAALESESIAVYMLAENGMVIGIKDGTDLKPIPIKDGSFSVPFWSPRGYVEGSKNTISFRLDAATDLNSIVAVTIASCDVLDDSDFFSLRAASATISSPATTGCVFTPTVTDVDPSAPATAINIAGIVHGEVTFTDNAGGAVVTLAGAGSLTYANGAYTVSESGLLTTQHTYTVKISHSGYDVTFTNFCVVP